MKDGEDLTSVGPVEVWRHPAAIEGLERRSPAYPAPRFHSVPSPADPAFAPWTPSARFAPLGPSRAALTVPAMVMTLSEPVSWPNRAAEPEATPEAAVGTEPFAAVEQEVPASPEAVPEGDDDFRSTEPHPAIAEPEQEVEPAEHEAAAEPAEFSSAATPEPVLHVPFWLRVDEAEADENVEEEFESTPEPEPEPEPAPAEAEPYLEPEPELPPVAEPATALETPPAEEPVAPVIVAEPPVGPPPPQTAYWATDPEPATSADSLAWTPPATEPGGKRPTPAMAGLWSSEPTLATQDLSALPQDRVVRPRRRRWPRIAAGIAILAALCVAGALVLPRLLSTGTSAAATFNAPMMVLRAATVGRVASVAVTNGQSVEPSTLLLTIHTDPQPDPAASLLQDRLEAARGRLAALDDALTQPTPNTDAGRSRLADLRSQRAAAADDVAQLRDGVAHLPAKPPTDQPVRAGIHGVIRSLEAQTGTATAAGVPLVRMLDCDHAFLTVGPDSRLHAGEAVQVRLPNLPPVPATVRNSSGIAEPPDSLVISPAPGAFVGMLSGSCPIGATATVTPSITGS